MSTRAAKTQKNDATDLNSRVEKMEGVLQTGLSELRKQISKIVHSSNSERDDASTPEAINEVIMKMNNFEDTIRNSLKTLKDDIDNIRTRMDSESQEHFNSQLIFHGIKESKDENINEMICEIVNEKVLKNINEKITVNDIHICYRLGKKREQHGKPRSVCVQFVHRWKREIVYHNKRCLKGSSVVIGEKLTSSRLTLYKKVREKFSGNSCWTSRGNIFVIVENSIKRIKSETDLNSM